LFHPPAAESLPAVLDKQNCPSQAWPLLSNSNDVLNSIQYWDVRLVRP
jgi:hypothetical protein